MAAIQHLTVFQGPRFRGQPNMSPFCTKLELYLRATGVGYEIRGWNPRTAPKGKMPFVDLGDGKLLGDSQLIIEHLKEVNGDSLDSGLTPDQHARGRSAVRMLEEATYWAGVYQRWVLPENFPIIKKAIFGRLPPPLKWILPGVVRRNVVKALHAQGTSRHSIEDIRSLCEKDINSICTTLGENQYFLGSSFCSYDCSIFAFLFALYRLELPRPILHELPEFEKVNAYLDRIYGKYFSDLK